MQQDEENRLFIEQVIREQQEQARLDSIGIVFGGHSTAVPDNPSMMNTMNNGGCGF